MTVVKINALNVPEGKSAALEERFAERQGSVDESPGFLGFKLLRPTSGEDRYFVYTEWETEEDFQNWAQGTGKRDHARSSEKNSDQEPVSSGANLLEFEVVLSSAPGENA